MFTQFLNKKADLLESLDPDRIYVENVRSFLNLPTKAAKLLCEMAVKQRLFKKKHGVYCPTCDRLVKSFDNLDEVDSTFECDVCRELEEPQYQFNKSEMKILTFYKLLDKIND